MMRGLSKLWRACVLDMVRRVVLVEPPSDCNRSGDSTNILTVDVISLTSRFFFRYFTAVF